MYKKGHKFLILFVLGCLGIAAFYFTWKFAFAYLAPDLYEGDRMETRDCRMCQGTGEDLGWPRTIRSWGPAASSARGKAEWR